MRLRRGRSLVSDSSRIAGFRVDGRKAKQIDEAKIMPDTL